MITPKSDLITVTAVQYITSGYGFQFCEIKSTDVDYELKYFNSKILELTEKEFLDLTKMPIDKLQAYSETLILNNN